jgi:hypothetical protein
VPVLAEDAGLLHGYLENQSFSTAVTRGKDIIWRRAVPQGDRAVHFPDAELETYVPVVARPV